MASEERQQQINTLVERLRELDLKKRAMDLVLQDFLEQRKKDAERLSKLAEMAFSCRVFENIHTGRNQEM